VKAKAFSIGMSGAAWLGFILGAINTAMEQNRFAFLGWSALTVFMLIAAPVYTIGTIWLFTDSEE